MSEEVNELNKLRQSAMPTLVVMGNGPSLKDVDFESLKNCHTVGMNAAYRHYYDTGWWPTYFCCFDYRVTDYHTAAWKKMIEDPDVPIKKYFLLKKISGSPKLHTLSLHGQHVPGKFSDKFESFGYGGCTGANSCQVGICLGYKKIIIVGVDCSYVQIVDGAKHSTGNDLTMTKTPDKNPNYFLDDYQREGDQFNIPNAHIFHEPAWKGLASFSKAKGVDIVNCSPASKLDCFRKSDLNTEIA
jgi:hypothetical protein